MRTARERWAAVMLAAMWVAAASAAQPGAAGDLVRAGRFFKIYDPGIGEERPWYINDHCIIRGREGTWHMFGITHAEPAKPLEEREFAHATSRRLADFPWRKEPHALTADPAQGEVHLWAPHVIPNEGRYWMFYCAGSPDHTRYRIHLATSRDLVRWERHPKNPVVVDGFDARDPMLLRVVDEWVMYYTATTEPAGGNHVVAYRKSRDLISWGERGIAFLDEARGTYGGPTESPFVVRRGGWYYLFIGPRGGYNGTDVFRSRDPFRWDVGGKVGHLPAHAAEIIQDRDGTWYISRCGWGEGGLYLAPLEWRDGPAM